MPNNDRTLPPWSFALVLGAAGCASTPMEEPKVVAADASGQQASLPPAEFCQKRLGRAAEHYAGFVHEYTKELTGSGKIPRSYDAHGPRLVPLSDWTSGFPAGSLWLLFEGTRAPEWHRRAETWTAPLEAERLNTGTHDIGFVINNTFGKGYRLTARPDYRQVVLDAAHSLATRYNPKVGATRSWSFGSWSFPVIIDNMMNLELLMHASKLGGDPSYADMAITHARTTLRNHFRPDGSSFHVVDYDPQSGAVVHKQTNQGIADDSAWARGQAWGLYGYTMMYRESKAPEFLAQARIIADFYIGHPNMPIDGVPYFDFNAPDRADVPNHRDASAGAIATSALLELASYVEPARAERYRDFALRALRSLSSVAYSAKPGQNGHFLLEHSVGNYPLNDEIDVAINYADYYYLEALLRCSKLE